MRDDGERSAARVARSMATLAVLACLVPGAVLTSCSDDSSNPRTDASVSDAGDEGDAGPGPVIAWHEPDYPYRVLVTVRPHPDRDRTNLPVIAEISHPGAFLARDIRVYDVSSDSTITAGLWSQPNGSYQEVGFTVPGTIPAGRQKRFLVYYKTTDGPEFWSGQGADWGATAEVDRDDNGVLDGYSLNSGRMELRRSLSESSGRLLRGRRDDGSSGLILSSGDWAFAVGFADSYQIKTAQETFGPRNVESEPPGDSSWDSDPAGLSTALGFRWPERTDPLPHDLMLTYRLFRDWPFLEQVLSASSTDNGAEDLAFSSASYSARSIYLSDSYDEMISDSRGTEAAANVWDTHMRWLVLHDTTTDRGVGCMLLSGRGVVRTSADPSNETLFDSYGYSAEGGPRHRILWMASAHADDIADLFDAMAPGLQVGTPESRDINIVAPTEDDYYFPQDLLVLEVTTPGQNAPVTATIELADGTTRDIPMERSEDPLTWRAVAPMELTADMPPGHWTVTATSADHQAQVGFEFRLPTHPHLFFSAEDLPSLQARTQDPVYDEIWQTMLHQAENYDDPIPDPGPGKDIRSYADRLMNLGLIQLLDPSQPYEDLLWTYFFTMLRYPNWDLDNTPFNNEDLTWGHFLTALSAVYDWHYDHLTSNERREVRRDLAQRAALFAQRHAAHYQDFDWHRFVTMTNNHYWIQNEGIAAVGYVLTDEVPDHVRLPLVDRTDANLANLLTVLEPDGSSNEGVAYHSYGQINLFRWLDMHDQAEGGNTAEANPWFSKSILWDLYSILPGGDDNYGGVANFGDCPTHHYQSPRTIQAWLAHRLGDGLAQWMAESLDWPSLTAMSILWYDPQVAVQYPTSLPTWGMFPFKGIFAWRSSWNDDATYFSLKSGAYYGGHEQPDAGHFILHRAGVPYVTDLGYSYFKTAEEHNLVMVDDSDQYGGQRQWMAAVDPTHWASAEVLVADASYFDILADPGPMIDHPALSDWTREVVGIGPDVFLVRDSLDATATVTYHWLLHSYRSDPPTSINRTYTYKDRRQENPFTTNDDHHFVITPQDSAPILTVTDLSHDVWSNQVEETWFVPEQKLDSGGYNSDFESYQLGYRLHREITAQSAWSLVALTFTEAFTVQSWSTAQAEAALIELEGHLFALVIWNKTSASLTGFHGYDVTGDMAGRTAEDPVAFFGRSVTHFAESGQVLLDADRPTDFYVRIEPQPNASDPRYALFHTTAQTAVRLRCPDEPGSVLLDGQATAFEWNAGVLILDIPSGNHRIDLQ